MRVATGKSSLASLWMADYPISLAQVAERIDHLPEPLYTLPLAIQEHLQAHILCATSQACAQPLHHFSEKECLAFGEWQSSPWQLRHVACTLRALDIWQQLHLDQ